jgi:hypothetical protein
MRQWLQVAGVVLLAGTFIPGVGASATVPALVGLALAAGAALAQMWESQSGTPRRAFMGLVLLIAAASALIAIPGGGYLAAAIGYYRPLAIGVAAAGFIVLWVALAAAWHGRPRWSIAALVLLAVSIKVAYAGIYVPEWNYRTGQGPWGRAIGQWVVPNWPIYTFHTWPEDLAFATGHPVRQLPDPRIFLVQPPPRPAHVLLLASEFEHWPTTALPLIKIRSFEDERGEVRVLARTPGDLGLRRGPED